MFEGYLAVSGVEILNSQRTEAYVSRLTGLEVKKETKFLREYLGHQPYTTPQGDGAPWVLPGVAASNGFLGIFSSGIQGSEDATMEVETTQYLGGGGNYSGERRGTMEFRITGTAIATTEEAMDYGISWLKQTLLERDRRPGSDGERTATMLAAVPTVSRLTDQDLFRHFYRVRVIDGPDFPKKPAAKRAVMRSVEIILGIGIPYAFTPIKSVGVAEMASAVNWADPAGENCSFLSDAYDDFINDPFYTAIVRPPRAPIIAPPNILKITSWRRKTIALPAAQAKYHGVNVPHIQVQSTNAGMQQMRLRFYYAGQALSGCSYVGEFLISYLPPNARMDIDCIRRRATVRLSNGKVVPGGHLLYGSDGNPYMWPQLDRPVAHTLVADIMPGQGDVTVTLQAAVRT